MKNSIYNQSGLIIYPRTSADRYVINKFLNDSDYYAEYDSESNCWLLPEAKDSIDYLEDELTEIFNGMNVNYKIEVNIF
jgi:hypothetical protein